MSMRRYSTTQVAQKLRMHQANLQRLIRKNSIPFPPIIKVGKQKFRLWTARDVERVRKLLVKRRSRRKKK